MKKASNFAEMINTFSSRPLDDVNIKEFYVNTSEARDCNPTTKIKLLFKNNPADNRKILFVGHNGSGKSTELNKVALSLQDDYVVSQFSIDSFVDVSTVSYIDLLFVILEELIKTVREHNYDVNIAAIAAIHDYWTQECTIIETSETEVKVGSESELKLSFLNLLSSKISAFFASGYKSREETKRKIEPSISELVRLMNNLINSIKVSLREKKLLMIIDNLDKLDLKATTELFVDHSKMITSLDMNIIYTFPIFMFYNSKFMYISPYFDDCFLLSMIKIKQPTGVSHDIGKDTLKAIVEKRTDTELFEPGVLDYAIEKSGGCIRTLMRLIRGAALEAEARCESMSDDNRSNSKIVFNDIRHSYSDYKSGMERLIKKEHLPALQEIYIHNNPIIDDDRIVSDLLMTLAVIEYNGKRWYALNPAIEDYLKEIHELDT